MIKSYEYFTLNEIKNYQLYKGVFQMTKVNRMDVGR